MAIVAVVGEKGGVGKSTLAVHLALWRAMQGRDVLLIDADPQGTATQWIAARNDAGRTPRIHSIQKTGRDLVPSVQDLATRYQDVVIDTGGRDSSEMRSALVVAGRAVIPLQASHADLWTVEKVVELLGQARSFNTSLEAMVVISRAIPNPRIAETMQAKDFLQGEYGDAFRVSETLIFDRMIYRRTMGEGMGVMEADDVKATSEVDKFSQEVWA